MNSKFQSLYTDDDLISIARRTCAEFEASVRAPARIHFVAGSIGLTTKALSITGEVTFEELIEHYHGQASGLFDGGADYFLIETWNDARNIKAALMNRDLLHLGLNCAIGPDFMTDHVRSLSQLSPFKVACVPKAGLPNEDGC